MLKIPFRANDKNADRNFRNIERWANSFSKRAAAIPTTGRYSVGDIIWNSEPASGEYIGWVCTVGGTPGTWKGFGLIA